MYDGLALLIAFGVGAVVGAVYESFRNHLEKNERRIDELEEDAFARDCWQEQGYPPAPRYYIYEERDGK